MRKKYFDEYGCFSKLYSSWKHMKERCGNPSCRGYRYWGGRGIAVCDEWKNDFLAFKEWALANGYKEGLTIDRIDNDGNYEPSNCRWTTMAEQSRNRNYTNKLTYNGETKILADWARETGVSATTIYMRINAYGWSVEKALTTATQKKGGQVCE